MVDNAMIERWNILDTADMAVQVKGILRRTIRGKPLPSTSKSHQSLGLGIEFLDEAKDGGSIILGTLAAESSFEGTLTPLCWAADICLEVEGPENDEAYKTLVETLTGYKKMLETLKEAPNTDVNEPSVKNPLQNVLTFFDNLADALIQQIDPTVKQYSHPTM